MKGKRLVKPVGTLGLVLVLVALSLAAACAPAPAPAPAPVPAPAPAPTHEEVRITILGATFGSGTYNFLVALERLSAKHPWLHLIATETPGYLWNTEELVRKQNRWTNTIIGSGTDTLLMGKMGMEPFTEPLPADVDDIVVLASFQLTSYGLVALDESITSPADLDGKKVGLGRKTQISWGQKPTLILTEGYGIAPEFEYLGPAGSMSALLDGRVKAAPAQFYTDGEFGIIRLTAQLEQLAASGKKFHYLTYSEEALDKAAAATGLEFLPLPVKAGSLPEQKEDLIFCHHLSTLWVHKSFPDEVAAEFARFMMENYKEFPKFTAGAETAVPVTFIYGFSEQAFHPAVVKVYKEYGIKFSQ